MYIGVNNAARKIKNCYVGVDGVARKVKAVYVGVNGVARLVWQSGLKFVSRYIYCKTGSTSISLHNYDDDNTTKIAGSIIESYNSEKLSCGILCRVYSSVQTYTSCYDKFDSIQRLTIDDNNNITKIERIDYNKGYSEPNYYRLTSCPVYLELGNYLFMVLDDATQTGSISRKYSVVDWSGNTLCSLDYLIPGAMSVQTPESGVVFFDSVVVVTSNCSQQAKLGVIQFNGSSLSQTYYNLTYVDSANKSYAIWPTDNYSMVIKRLSNNTGLVTFHGGCYSSETTASNFVIPFRINNDNTLSFGKTLCFGSSTQTYGNFDIPIFAFDNNHAIVCAKHYSYGTSSNGYTSYYYQQVLYALYIDNNLNISITDTYNIYDKTPLSFSKGYTLRQIGRSYNFGFGDSNTSKECGVFLYKLDIDTNKIVYLGKFLPETKETNMSYIYDFTPLSDDKIFMTSYGTSSTSSTPLYATVCKFA